MRRAPAGVFAFVAFVAVVACTTETAPLPTYDASVVDAGVPRDARMGGRTSAA